MKTEEYRYREGYDMSLEGKRVEGDRDMLSMWEQVKRAIFETVREVCGSVGVGEKNPKRVGWNDEVKDTVRRNKAAWKEGLAASNEEAK